MINPNHLLGLRLDQFSQTKYAIKFECPVGVFWLCADKFTKPLPEQEPRFGCAEMSRFYDKMGKTKKPLEFLHAILLVKKNFEAKILR